MIINNSGNIHYWKGKSLEYSDSKASLKTEKLVRKLYLKMFW